MFAVNRHKRIMETRDDPIKRLNKRGDDRYAEDRKRTSGSERYEAPPPPRFDASLASSRRYSFYLET